VTGSIKYDGVVTDRGNARTEELRRLLAIGTADLVWVAGSTQAPEEQITLDVFRRVRDRFPHIRFILVPRQRDRFEKVALLLKKNQLPFIRRSELKEPVGQRNQVILVDTIGELGAIWGLADVAYVGGSLDGLRGGQNMIEPAAYGAAVVFGSHVWNFRETAQKLLQGRAAIQVADAGELEKCIQSLLQDSLAQKEMGKRAQQMVREQQGATERTLAVIERLPIFDNVGKAA
jgi:3-deoxy-D-manno-octulosonic-acid transferase